MCSVMPMVEILSYFSKDLPQGMSSVAPFCLFNASKDLPQVTVQAPHSSLVIRGLCPYSFDVSQQSRATTSINHLTSVRRNLDAEDFVVIG